MERVFSFAERRFENRDFAAVAIGTTGAGQRHLGILYRFENGQPSFLHLAWHCRLRNDSTLPSYLALWVASPAPQERLRQLAAVCRRIWRKHAAGGIPYAFSHPEGLFDGTTGELLFGPSRLGLTCASFVLAVFHAAGLPLADYDRWPAGRAGDEEWQAAIVAALRRSADPEHVKHVQGEIGAVRYRPEEVAAASACAPPPAEFSLAERLGSIIVARLDGGQPN